MTCLVSGLHSLQFGLTGALQEGCPELNAGQAAAAAALQNFRWAQHLYQSGALAGAPSFSKLTFATDAAEALDEVWQ